MPTVAPDLELFNPEGRAPVLVLCDHGGRNIPRRLGGLGISAEALARHIGWDIGAADLARRLARRLDAPAILSNVSRLVIDANRRPLTASSIPAISDGCVIPGNEHLSPAEIRRRIFECFLPYHRTVARRIGRFRRAGIVPAIVAVHSFTPRMNGEDRPWQVGIVWRGDERLSRPVLAALRAIPGLVVGDNQPYSGLTDFGFTVTFHAQRTRLPHIMLEIRQDEIAERATAERWGDILFDALALPLRDPELYKLLERSDHAPPATGWRHAGLVVPRP
jgi:predicted N-formylglutamate amidohydrolase